MQVNSATGNFPTHRQGAVDEYHSLPNEDSDSSVVM